MNDKDKLSKDWLKLKKIDWEIRKMCLGESSAEYKELKEISNIISSIMEKMKNKIEEEK